MRNGEIIRMKNSKRRNNLWGRWGKFWGRMTPQQSLKFGQKVVFFSIMTSYKISAYFIAMI